MDKLLDAGCSSFHFETAKEFKKNNSPTAAAAVLGPIHIDVSENDASNSRDLIQYIKLFGLNLVRNNVLRFHFGSEKYLNHLILRVWYRVTLVV